MTRLYECNVPISVEAENPAEAARKMFDYLLADPALHIHVRLNWESEQIYEADKRTGQIKLLRDERESAPTRLGK